MFSMTMTAPSTMIAEVHRPQRQQVGRNADYGQADEGAEQGEWNDGGDDAGGSQVARKM